MESLRATLLRGAPQIGATLMGASMGFLARGSGEALVQEGNTRAISGAAAMVSLLGGLLVPRLAARGLWRWRHWRSLATHGAGADFRRRDPLDIGPAFAWMQVAVLAMFAGLVAAFSPLLAQAAGAAGTALRAGFYWTTGSAALRDVWVVMTSLAFPLLAIGSTLVCLQRLAGNGAWRASALGWPCVGAGAASLLLAVLRWRPSPETMERLAVLPAMGLSLLAVYFSALSETHAASGAETSKSPQLAPLRRGGLAWAASRVAWAAVVGALGLAAVGLRDDSSGIELDGLDDEWCSALLLISFGIGCACGGRRPDGERRAKGDDAMAVLLAALVLATVPALSRIEAGVRTIWSTGVLCIAVFGCGCAWGLLVDLNRRRAPHPPDEGFRQAWLLLAGVLVVGALTSRVESKPATWLLAVSMAAVLAGSACVLRLRARRA